jgi:hypothetical protein
VNIARTVINDGGRDLEAAALQSLTEVLRSVGGLRIVKIRRQLAGASSDFEVEVQLEGRRKAYLAVEVKRNPKPDVFHRVVRRSDIARRGLVRVLAALRISERIEALCAEHGWSWIDLAGNCRLHVPGGLHIERTGRQAVALRDGVRARLSSDEAGQVVRLLLADENAGRRWTQREVVAQSEARGGRAPSLGLVNKVVRRLIADGVAAETPQRGFRIADPEGLLLAWSTEYRFEAHARVEYFTLLKGRALAEAVDRLSAATNGRTAYAAFSAADRQAPHVRQPNTWLYVAKEHEEDLRRITNAKPVDTGGNLTVLFPQRDGIFHFTERASGDASCTAAFQTYADLRRVGGRGEEAANALLEQRLRPAWKSGAAERK